MGSGSSRVGVGTPSEFLARALDHADRGEWQAAGASLDRAGDLDESAAGLELRATLRYRDGSLDEALESWEQLHRLHRQRGETIEAARAGAMVAVHLLIDSGIMGAVRGWLTRVEDLLVEHEDTPVHALLAMVHAYERFMAGDPDAARDWSARAIDLGRRHDLVPPQILGRMCSARVRILEGEVADGLRELEAVAELLLSGEVEPLTTGIMVCELICAMQGLAMYDRAEQWTAAFERLRSAGELFGGVGGRCRVHRAEILRLRGACEEAEREAVAACEELRPWMRREFGWPLTELGTIRLRRGDLAGAEEAFVAAHGNGWDPQPGLACVRLAQGDVAGARRMIEEALERPSRIPSKERPPVGGLQRAPLLEVQVQIALASADEATARAACDELARIADQHQSPALLAMADLAEGRIRTAGGDLEEAVERCRRAVERWCDVGAPFEASVARLALAEALDADGDADLARVERLAATTLLDDIGAVSPEALARRATGTSAPEAEDQLDAPAEDAPAVFRCEGDMRTVRFQGVTVHLRDLVGMRYLERLLAEPDREFHVLDLVAAVRGIEAAHVGRARPSAQPQANEDTGPLLDDRARRAYRNRLVEIEEDLADAEERGDAVRAELARRDRDFILAELSRAFGLGGRSRTSTSTSERARTSVTRAVRYALTRIAEHHPELADHLRRSVSTGVYCSYAPDPGLDLQWSTR